jgi:hypothetical protein
LGYRLVYEPRAIVYNRGPTTVSDYLRQRRRINSGHLRILQQQRYAAPTMNGGRIVRALLAEHPFDTPRTAWWTVGTVGLEALARWLGTYDNMRRRPHYLWQMAMTTKGQIAGELSAYSYQSVLVFHIVDYHDYELELGARGAQALTQQLAPLMRQALGPQVIVNPERNGAVIALAPIDQEEAERAASRLIETIQSTPLRVNGRSDGVSVRLACGIIAFLQTGATSATSVLAAPS